MDGKSSSQKQVSLKRSGVEVPRLSELAAEWQTKKYGEQIQDQVLKDKILIRIKEATALIKDSASKQEGVGGDHVFRMEWDQLYDISANVMDEYTKNVDTILTQLDQLYRVCIKHLLETQHYVLLTLQEIILVARIGVPEGLPDRSHCRWTSGRMDETERTSA